MTRVRRRAVVVALTIGLLALPATTASADLEDELSDVLNRIEDLEGRVDEAAAGRSDIVGAILEARDRLQGAQTDLDEAEDALLQIRLSLADNKAELATTQQQLQESHESAAATQRRMEESRGDAQDWVRHRYMRQSEGAIVTTLVSTDQISDVARALYFLETVADRSSASIDRYQALGREGERQQARIEAQELHLASVREALATAEVEQDELAAERRARAATVRAEVEKEQALLDALDHLIEEFETELDGLDAEQERLERLIQGSSGSGGTAPGLLVRPVPGKITSAFGPRYHPILGYTRMHTGIDMSAPYGQEIKAGAAGRVILTGTYGGYGLTVIIDHGGGMTTLYAHQSRVIVGVGTQVAAGEVIGHIGSSGLATGPHLHFEVRIAGSPVDPAPYL
jgi:murein DD-endopeptidase MepM/ murein hydrolase activator NlpD